MFSTYKFYSPSVSHRSTPPSKLSSQKDEWTQPLWGTLVLGNNNTFFWWPECVSVASCNTTQKWFGPRRESASLSCNLLLVSFNKIIVPYFLIESNHPCGNFMAKEFLLKRAEFSVLLVLPLLLQNLVRTISSSFDILRVQDQQLLCLIKSLHLIDQL